MMTRIHIYSSGCTVITLFRLWKFIHRNDFYYTEV